MQDRIHLFRDRHLDSAGVSQADRGLSGENTFRDGAMHAGDDVRQACGHGPVRRPRCDCAKVLQCR